jgi:alpha/beta hydrolase family protein
LATARCTNSLAATIPLLDTPEERPMTGDPRKSILERYPDSDTYVAAIRSAARQLAEDGLMLEEDVERTVAGAVNWGRPRHDTKLK